jgi:hypothetical protein
MLLTSTADLVQIITGSAANIDVVAEYADLAAGVVSVGRQLTKIPTATTTTIVGSPGASTARKVKELLISNNHATNPCVVTIQQYDGTNTVIIESINLLAGERIGYRESTGFTLIGADGVDKLTGYPRASGSASVAAQAGFAADTYVAGSSMNVAGRLQAASFFRWRISMSKTAAGIAAPTFNVRFGTAGAVGDASRCLFTGPAQTAVADTAILEITAQMRAVGAAAQIQGELELHHNLAATGFATTGPSGLLILSTTGGTFDSTVANSIIGLSMNGGASAAWTVTSCVMDAVNLLP